MTAFALGADAGCGVTLGDGGEAGSSANSALTLCGAATGAGAGAAGGGGAPVSSQCDGASAVLTSGGADCACGCAGAVVAPVFSVGLGPIGGMRPVLGF